MKQVLPLNKGINLDTNPLYLGEGEVLSRKNCRITSPSGGKEAINASMKGMSSLTTFFPVDGTNKTIGFIEDKERDRGVFFVYNSIGNHDIYLVSGTTITPLGADPDVLNFQSNEIIDADILGDYCVFVSDYNPPRKIDITEDLTGKDDYAIQLAVRPPSEKPTTVIGSDKTRVVNKLVGKTFQFATLFIYDDYTYSVLSPYSDLVVSSAVFSAKDDTYDNNAIGNYVQVSYDLGYSNVRSVKLLAREGNTGGWFEVEEYETGGATGSRTISFYNDVARKALSETEATALYSDVPRLARSVRAVQNRMVMGNVLKGYDRTDIDFSLGIEYETVSVSGSTVDLANADGLLTPSAPASGYAVMWDMPVVYAAGNFITISIEGGYYQELAAYQDYCDFNYAYEYSTEITQDDIDTGDPKTAIMSRMVTDINSKSSTIVTVNRGAQVPNVNFSVGAVTNELSKDIGIVFIIVFNENGNDGAGGGAGSFYSFYNGSFSADTVPEGVSTFKAGSYYNIGVLLYDEFSRTSGVLSPQKIYVPHAGERDYANAFDRARITFDIPDGSGMPSWAKYYRLAVTESVNFTGVYPFVVGNDVDDNGLPIYNIVSTFLDGNEVIAINMPTNLQYEFVKGDYLQIEIDNGVDEITNTIQKNIIGTRTIIEIDDEEKAGFWLIVPKAEEEIETYDGNLAYVYRLKNEVSDLVYFEDSNTYEITDNAMQTLSGYVGGEDAWYVERSFKWEGVSVNEVDVIVEDFYINVNDAVRAYSKGRVVVEFDTLGEVRLQDIVWSFNYLDNTKINGISTFNSLNRKQLDERDGDIQRVELIGYVLKVIQDNKETSMYIGVNEITDANGNVTAVATNDFVGTVRPMVDDYGTRHPLSIAQNDRNMWYFDGDKGAVIQSSPNGQVAVSNYGMRSKFLRISKLSLDKVFAYFDEKNEQYVITFDCATPITYAFKGDANIWELELEYTDASGDAPDIHGAVGTSSYSFGFNKVWKHEENSSYNTFFNSFKPLSVRGVINTPQTEEKCLRALETDSNRAPNVVIETPIANTTPLGQKSYLYPATFRNRLGNFTSSVFKNVLVVGGEDINQIHSGDDMVGKYIEIEFSDSNATEYQLRLATANLTTND